MITLPQLWAPILLSAFLVFFASALIHMVFKWHNKDYQQLPNEDEVRAAIRKGNPAPGQYVTPYCMDMKQMSSPEMQQKYTEGPVGVFYFMRPGAPNMGPQLGKWFIFNLVVSFFTAYVGIHGLQQPSPEYLRVFQLTGTAAFMAYAFGSVPAGIWMGKPWGVVWKEVLDGLIYGLVTAGSFGWLWPR
jgi:hypothetical protein